MEQIQIFRFKEQDIEFDLTNDKLMINATEMAKIFGNKPIDFLRTEPTKAFIQECISGEYIHHWNIKSEDDLVVIRPNKSTWMHRVLALKFAAWLNPTFELWVYRTIDDVLFGSYRKNEQSLKESAARKNEMDQLRAKLQETEEYRELERLELAERQASYSRGRIIKNQLDLFRAMEEPGPASM